MFETSPKYGRRQHLCLIERRVMHQGRNFGMAIFRGQTRPRLNRNHYNLNKVIFRYYMKRVVWRDMFAPTEKPDKGAVGHCCWSRWPGNNDFAAPYILHRYENRPGQRRAAYKFNPYGN